MMTMNATLQLIDTKALYKHARNNRFEVAHSDHCACFFCGDIFAPEQITEWTDKDMTALCPHCKMDAVLPAYNGIPTDTETLMALNKYAF